MDLQSSLTRLGLSLLTADANSNQHHAQIEVPGCHLFCCQMFSPIK